MCDYSPDSAFNFVWVHAQVSFVWVVQLVLCWNLFLFVPVPVTLEADTVTEMRSPPFWSKPVIW